MEIYEVDEDICEECGNTLPFPELPVIWTETGEVICDLCREDLIYDGVPEEEFYSLSEGSEEE